MHSSVLFPGSPRSAARRPALRRGAEPALLDRARGRGWRPRLLRRRGVRSDFIPSLAPTFAPTCPPCFLSGSRTLIHAELDVWRVRVLVCRFYVMHKAKVRQEKIGTQALVLRSVSRVSTNSVLMHAVACLAAVILHQAKEKAIAADQAKSTFLA